jgi:hypothetical protein
MDNRMEGTIRRQRREMSLEGHQSPEGAAAP